MLIEQTITWPAVNWPTTSPATEYGVYQVYPTGPTLLQTVSAPSATLSFDDSLSLAFQVRPTNGTNIGPECFVYVSNYVPCRAWLRQKIRIAIADRLDLTTSSTPNWPDDELNTYIGEGLTELNLFFPLESDTVITLTAPILINGVTSGVRDYTLPPDYLQIKTVEYITPDGKLHLYLKEKPWRGGESTATSYLGYPKLGILISPLAGRYFPGHFDIFENGIHLDWDPVGDGDYLKVRYFSKRPQPVNDADVMQVLLEDMELMSLYAQMKCWMRVEAQDTRLSRWRSKEDGGKRDDMPTVRHSSVIRSLYQERINDRREQRPRTALRLVRR